MVEPLTFVVDAVFSPEYVEVARDEEAELGRSKEQISIKREPRLPCSWIVEALPLNDHNNSAQHVEGVDGKHAVKPHFLELVNCILVNVRIGVL